MLRFKLCIQLSLLIAFFASCKAPQLQIESISKKIPSTYTPNGDTSAKAIEGWKEVFIDPSLMAIIDTALKNNYDLKAALQKVELARSGLLFNKGIRLPEIMAQTAVGRRKFGEYTMDGVGNYDTRFSPNLNDKQQIPNVLPDYYVGFQAAWEIDLWGKLKNKKKAAAAKFIASQYGKDLILTNLIAEVATTYFQLLALDKEAQILIDNIALQQAALELVTAQKEAGKATELAVEMIKAQLLTSKALEAQVLQSIVETESRLSFLSGRYPTNLRRDSLSQFVGIKSNLAIGVPSDLLKNRADIRQAEFDLMASTANVKAAQAAFYPSLTLSAAYGLQSFNALLLLETPASLAYNVLGGLTAPLVNRRALKAELLASKSEQKQTYINYEKTVVTAFGEVYIALSNIKNTKTMVELKAEEVRILKKSITTSSELFKAGRANYLEIITSQKNSLQAQLELITFEQRQNTALVDLYRAIGGGWK